MKYLTCLILLAAVPALGGSIHGDSPDFYEKMQVEKSVERVVYFSNGEFYKHIISTKTRLSGDDLNNFFEETHKKSFRISVNVAVTTVTINPAAIEKQVTEEMAKYHFQWLNTYRWSKLIMIVFQPKDGPQQGRSVDAATGRKLTP